MYTVTILPMPVFGASSFGDLHEGNSDDDDDEGLDVPLVLSGDVSNIGFLFCLVFASASEIRGQKFAKHNKTKIILITLTKIAENSI